ncbi:hypothetical protein GXP67_05335 [Rhodocytophaga rosea]|uniref:Uncharacterized protein n=1 Tax=Rhodocytophaga rosea TaxID=2704465 RepID=A0A6C0GEG4_9BACT|nr:hypothetical protein [Rhodocytophaga rosea]QHT66132.1 hypothetical protein GXP67_05335 [Rhodocytophaga rosea]
MRKIYYLYRLPTFLKHSVKKQIHQFLFLTGSIAAIFLSATTVTSAQTPTDGLMMSKGQVCVMAVYTHDRWQEYWEGGLKRENFNLGKVTTQSGSVMAAAGLTKHVNIMASLPYVSVQTGAGTFNGRRGFQDASVAVKVRPFEKDALAGKLSAMTVLGFSTPASNYVADYLPMSIGLRSTTGSLRGIVHYKHKTGIFTTLQAGYIRRSNIKIDRYAYYTDRQYNTNEVWMPDVASYSARAGYYSKELIAEAWIDHMQTLGGTDIRRNDMPFPSNRMIATRVGVMGTYRLPFMKNLSVLSSVGYTVAGRNVGQSTSISGGISYIIDAW